MKLKFNMRYFKKVGYFFVLFFGFLFCKDIEMNNLIIVVYRGVMGYEMENIIVFVEKVLELKVFMIEIDVF